MLSVSRGPDERFHTAVLTVTDPEEIPQSHNTHHCPETHAARAHERRRRYFLHANRVFLAVCVRAAGVCTCVKHVSGLRVYFPLHSVALSQLKAALVQE